jgi:hypothetical protein
MTKKTLKKMTQRTPRAPSPAPAPVTPMPSAVAAFEPWPVAVSNANVQDYEARVHPQFVQEFNRLMFGGGR